MWALTALNIVSLLLVIAIVVVGIFGARRIRIAAVVGGVFWVLGLSSTWLPAAIGMDDTAQILFLLLFGIFHIFAVASLALAGMLPAPRPGTHGGGASRYNPNPPPYGTSHLGTYDHLPRAGERPTH